MSLTRPKIAQFDTTATALRDPLTTLNAGSSVANVDIGFILNRSSTLSNVALYWSESGNTIAMAFTNNTGVTNSNISIESYANLRAGVVTVDSLYTNGFSWSANGEPVTLGSLSSSGTTPPSGPKPGDSWYDTTDGIWYVYQVTEGGSYWVDMYTQTLNPTLITSSDVAINGNVLPAGNVVYNLGSPTSRWKDLYLSGSTIDLNGAQISSSDSSIVMTNPLGGSFTVAGSESGKASATFGNIIANSGVTSTSVYTGALQVDGGVGVLGNVFASAVYSNTYKFSNGSPYIAALATSGVTAGIYGSATSIPTVVVDSYGRITSVTANAVSTAISLVGTIGSGSVSGGGTLTFASDTGFTSYASGSTVTLNTPQDLRATASPSFNNATMASLQTPAIGNVTPGTGAFTTLTASGNLALTSSSSSTSASTGALVVTGGAGVGGNLYVSGNIVSTSTAAITIPVGTTAQRPLSPALGMSRFNSSNNGFEVYGNNGWILVGAKDGSSYAAAADSATALYDLGLRGKGLYWIKKADGNAIQVYCDLDTLGQDGKGGWMLVGSWATASEWTKDSTSSSSTFGATALNCFSSNFGNTNMQHMRIKVSAAIDTASASSEADFYYYWSSAVQWKTVWAAGAGTNTHYNSSTVNAGGSVPRNSLRQFSYAYNLKFGYTANYQVWANLSDSGTTGSTGTEEWRDWYSGLTTPGVTLGANMRGDGSLAITFGGDTSTGAGQDTNYQNAKYGYDDTGVCAWGGTTGTNNMNANTGTQGSNTNLWMWIK